MQACCGLDFRCSHCECSPLLLLSAFLGLILKWTAKPVDRGDTVVSKVIHHHLPPARQRFGVKTTMADSVTICFGLLHIHCDTSAQRHATTFLSNKGLSVHPNCASCFLPRLKKDARSRTQVFLFCAYYILCRIGIAASSVFRPKFFEGFRAAVRP